jgi:hypothetical protein
VAKAMELSWSNLLFCTIAVERFRCFIPSSNYTFLSKMESEKDYKRRNWEFNVRVGLYDITKNLDSACISLYPTALRLDE